MAHHMGAARPCVVRLAGQRHVLLSADLGSVVPSVACAIGVVRTAQSCCMVDINFVK